MKKDKFYITTPLYYVNASPHIGHSYTNVAADALARYKRMQGCDVYFLTGTDEHGQKVEKAAIEAGFSDVKVFCDSIVEKFNQLWKELDITYDDFIRTTDKRHKDAVEKILNILYQKGEIYESKYEGWYCAPCETFWIKDEISNDVCPDCSRKVEYIAEKNYFLKISKYRNWLKEYLNENKNFILPKSRFNEICSFLEDDLLDLCISRPSERVRWGIPIPFSKGHVTYVWFDALLNYITAPGFADNQEKFSKLWPADVHFIGKDILRYHAVYWPIMLHMLGLKPPLMIFAHGWWLSEDSGKIDKISKSKGNIIDPRQIAEKYSNDALRYFLLREVPFGFDGTFSEAAFIQRINSDLANDFGNLIYRTLNMLLKYYSGIIPFSKSTERADDVFKDVVDRLYSKVDQAMQVLNFQEAIIEIWELIRRANKYIEVKAPWKLKKDNLKELDSMMYNLAEVLRIVLVALAPFLPESTQKGWGYLGFKDDIKLRGYKEISKWGLIPCGQKVEKGEPLFPRIE